MTDQSLELISHSLRWEFEPLRARMKEGRHASDGDALPYALAALHIVDGTDREVEGYRRLSSLELAVMRGLFRTTTSNIARRLLREHPEQVDEVRTHEWILDKLGSGPMKRLSPKDQAIRGLQGLLMNPHNLAEYQRRGHLAWDDGDALTAMLVVYNWPKSIVERTYTVTPEDVETVRETALDTHPDNPFLRVIDNKCRLAWEDVTVAERERLTTELQNVADRHAEDGRTRVLRLVALASVVDVGLRFRNPELAEWAIEQLQEEVAPGEADHPRLQLLRAWTAARNGDAVRAQELATESLRTDQELVRADTAQILEAVGQHEAAMDALSTVTHLVHPDGYPEAGSRTS